MSNYVKRTTTFLLCLACVFPHKVTSDESNVATLQTFIKKDISENFVNPNLINKDSLGITQGATRFTGSSKPSHTDDGMQRINSENSFANVVGPVNDYSALLGKTNSQQLLRKKKKMIKNILTGIYTPDQNPDYPTEGRRDDNLSGIRNSPVFHTKDFGDHCKNDMECGMYSKCKGSKCICIPHFNYKENTCLPARIGDTCTTESECPLTSICQNSKCSCSSRYINMGIVCVPRKIGSNCKETVECPISSVCRNGRCACKDGYVNVNNECQLDVDECKKDSDCWKILNNSTCFIKETGNYCYCKPTEIATSTQCLPKEVKIGDSCKISSQCLSESGCINGTCVCRKEYIIEGLNCVKANLGSCEEFITCPENSECVNGFCVCRDDFAKRGQECAIEPYNVCYNDNDCLEYWENTKCIIKDDGNKCQCPTGFVIGANGCIPKRNNGESCQLTSQCPWTSLCKNGICVCRDSFTTKNNKCVKREVGDPCESSYQCPADNDCDDGFCTCWDYYTAESGVCVKSKLGNPCNKTKDCPQWDLCHEGTCICDHGYEERNNICVSKFVGGRCQSSQYCPEKTICMAGTCVCRSTYVTRGLECVSTSSDIPDYVWAIIGATVGVVIISIATAILVVRGRRTRALRHNLPTVSSVVESRHLSIPPPSYESIHATQEVNGKY